MKLSVAQIKLSTEKFGWLLAILCLNLLYVCSGLTNNTPEATGRFSQLSETYLSRGIEGFLRDKEVARRNVARTLSEETPGSPKAIQATRIAAYMFPEVLPENDFERQIAQQGWRPIELAIEKSPRTPQSKELFEELRSEIWNYEAARGEGTGLSEDARMVIRIYEVLSTK
jgi:hypothetical protein